MHAITFFNIYRNIEAQADSPFANKIRSNVIASLYLQERIAQTVSYEKVRVHQ
jgi:hypothetical protein